MPFSVRINYRGSGLPQPETVRTVSRSRITVGRASDCDVVLDDPKRHVSRVHAVVMSREGHYILNVVSNVNYVVVNGRQIMPGSSTAVKPGDQLEIGDFGLEVLARSVGTAQAQTVSMDVREHPAQTAAAARPVSRAKGLIASLAEEAPVEPPAPVRAAAPVAALREAKPAGDLHAAEKMLRKFMEGAGLESLQPPADSERFMRECGALLRAALEGIIGLLMARAEMKKEMRAEDRTMVSSRDNNPLKLMTDVQEVLGYLLDPQAPDGAFLPPVRAVQEACDDLRSHDLALMAAMRAAIMGAIERFDPAQLEDGLAHARGGITLNKKAALWDYFVTQQARLLRETEDDFNQVFAKEFLGTYNAQVQRLRGKR